jgi:hypothetical protein
VEKERAGMFKVGKEIDFATLVAVMLVLSGCTTTAQDQAAEGSKQPSAQVFQRFVNSNAIAAKLARDASAVLVFPVIAKPQGESDESHAMGTLLKAGQVVSYHSAVMAKSNVQAEVSSFGYAVFLMNYKAAWYAEKVTHWEIGSGPTVAVVDNAAADRLLDDVPRSDAYALFFDHRGKILDGSVEGAKITRIKPDDGVHVER